MFEDSVLENRIARKRRWPTLASFAIECVGILVLVLIPLLYTEALPNLNILTRVPPPTAPAPPHVDIIATHHENSGAQSEFVDGALVAPPKVPDRIPDIYDRIPPAQSASEGPLGFMPGPVGNTENNPIISEVIRPRTPIVPTLKPTVYRISHLDEGQIIRRVQPTYPAMARNVRVQGPVTLEALIGRDGRIEQLRAVSGHPLLITAAMDAVQQWRYRPYLLNGSPVEVQTTITVNFYLNSN